MPRKKTPNKIYVWKSYQDVPTDDLIRLDTTHQIIIPSKYYNYNEHSFSVAQLTQLLADYAHLSNVRLGAAVEERDGYNSDGYYNYGYSEFMEFVILHDEVETEKEFIKRKTKVQKERFKVNEQLKVDKNMNDLRQARELAEYERLKKIYG